ncbi:MAG: glycosyltransferase [Hyphomicrobium sp.]
MIERRRVCIVTRNQLGSNPRVVKEADALHEAGFDVTVIAPRTLELVDRRDEALMTRIPWRLDRIDLRSRSVWLRLRAVQLAARRAYDATGAGSLAARALSPFTPALRHRALRTPADLYIAHYPDALAAVAAAAGRHGARYAYDAEDFHLGDWPDDADYDPDRRLLREIEGRYLPGCAYITAASPLIAEGYQEAYAIPHPTVVLNVFSRRQGSGFASARGSIEPGPSLYWFSQTIGPDRGLECAVRAIAMAQTRPHLYLRGTLAADYADVVSALADGAGVAERVHLLSPACPDEMETLASAYDLGLVSETGHSASRQYCLTNKLFTYLLAGIPPLMSDTPAHRQFAQEAGLTDTLYPVDDAAALARLIDGILGSPSRLACARANALRLALERYNWETEQVRLVAEVEAVFAQRSPRGAPLTSSPRVTSFAFHSQG